MSFGQKKDILELFYSFFQEDILKQNRKISVQRKLPNEIQEPYTDCPVFIHPLFNIRFGGKRFYRRYCEKASDFIWAYWKTPHLVS